MPTIEELEQGFMLGDWQVLPKRRQFIRGDEVVQPEPLPLKVLLSLAARNGEAVTKDQLVDECWGGRATADAPITRCIAQLRKLLGDTERPYRYIDVLVRTGYFLKQPVVLLDKEADDPAPADADEPASAPVSRRSYLGALVATLAIVALLAVFLIDKEADAVNSIAVMPFTNLTEDSANAYIAEGFKVELVHTLQTVPELAIKNVQVPDARMEVPELGRSLEVDYVLVGALRIEGMELKFSYQLVRVDDGIIISSGQVSGARDRLFSRQEELANLVKSQVVGNEQQPVVSRSRPQNSMGYDRYLLGQYLMERRRREGNLEDAIALFEESIDLDPGFGPAYLALAEIYALLPDYRGWNREEANAAALRIAGRGIDADPAIEDAAASVIGFVYHKQRKWAEAEAAFTRATGSSVVEPNAFNWYSLMLGSVGRFDEALHQVSLALEKFPRSAVLHSRIAVVHAWNGNTSQADLYFERARQLGVGGGSFDLAHAVHLMRKGAFTDATRAASRGVADGGGPTDWVNPMIAAIQGEGDPAIAIAALDDATALKPLNPQVEATARAILGDLEGAMRVARSLAQSEQSYETEFLFLDELAALHARPDFLPLLESLGITAYWEQAGCRWQQRMVDCD